LPDPDDRLPWIGDPILEIAALFAQSLGDDRNRARQTADAEERNISAATASRVSQMHQAADDLRAAGNWAALQGVLEGGGQLAGVCIGSPAQGETNWAGACSAGGKVAGSLAGLQGNGRQEQQKGHDAEAVASQGHAEAAQRRFQFQQDEASAARDQLVRVLALLKEIRAAQNGALSAAVVRA